MKTSTYSEITDEPLIDAENSGVLPESSMLCYKGEFYDRFEAGAVGSSKQYSDIPFWIALAKNYSSPILELGCGTGRISIPLAEAGFNVTGLDISEEMLSVARKKSSQVNWVHANAQSFDLKEKFSLILFPYNAMLHLNPDQIRSCLNSVRQHLKINGRLVIDIANPSPSLLLKLLHEQEEVLASIFQDPNGGGTIVVVKHREYDAANQIVTMKRTYRFTEIGKEVSERLEARIYFPQEIDTLLRWSGFEIEQKLGNYDFSPFTSNSLQQLIVCHPVVER